MYAIRILSIQVQYVFLHMAILDGITSVGTDIPVDKLEKKIAELSEKAEEGDSGFAVEFNVSPTYVLPFNVLCSCIKQSTVSLLCYNTLVYQIVKL